MIRDLCRQIAEEKIKPVAAQYDEDGEFPWDIVKVFAESDLFGVFDAGGIRRHGRRRDGDGAGHRGAVQGVRRHRPRLRPPPGSARSRSSCSAPTSRRRSTCPPIARGEKLAAFALTEADAGSTPAGFATTAVEDGDEYVLNGTKQWITNGGEAEIYTVIAMTNKAKGARGASAFIVEKGTPGLHVRQEGEQDGHPRVGDARADLPGLPHPEGEPDRAARAWASSSP